MTERNNPIEPPHPRTAAGAPRRVGVEIEFGGMEVADAAALVGDVFGGNLVEDNPNRFLVEKTTHGDFIVELDADKLQPEDDDDADGPLKEIVDKVSEKAYRALGAIAGAVVPVEVVAPPIPWDEISALDGLVAKLRDAGAQGTDEGLSHAFGTHLNPEVARMEADDVCRHLKSYLLLSPSLRRDIDVDPARQILPFIDPFPDDYVEKVVDPSYAPDWTELIDDYLAANPSRNRELDMLPLFSEKDAARVRRTVDDDRIKSRPTFHYRLPETRLADPDWTITAEWNRWIAVERLAADAEGLRRAAASFRAAGGDEGAIRSLARRLAG